MQTTALSCQKEVAPPGLWGQMLWTQRDVTSSKRWSHKPKKHKSHCHGQNGSRPKIPTLTSCPSRVSWRGCVCRRGLVRGDEVRRRLKQGTLSQLDSRLHRGKRTGHHGGKAEERPREIPQACPHLDLGSQCPGRGENLLLSRPAWGALLPWPE